MLATKFFVNKIDPYTISATLKILVRNYTRSILFCQLSHALC